MVIEYLLDFGQAEVRTSDFGWAPVTQTGEFLEFERLEQSSVNVIGPENPTTKATVSSLEGTNSGVLHYVPRVVTDDDDRVPADHPGVLPQRWEPEQP